MILVLLNKMICLQFSPAATTVTVLLQQSLLLALLLHNKLMAFCSSYIFSWLGIVSFLLVTICYYLARCVAGDVR